MRDNQIVHRGEFLYQIDQTPFRIAAERAGAGLAAAGQAVGTPTARSGRCGPSAPVEDTATRTNVRDAARVFELVRVGVYPQVKGDQARGELDAGAG